MSRACGKEVGTGGAAPKESRAGWMSSGVQRCAACLQRVYWATSAPYPVASDGEIIAGLATVDEAAPVVSEERRRGPFPR